MVVEYLVNSGVIFDVGGMFFVNMSVYIVRFRRIVMINEIFLLDLGGKKKVNIVKIVSVM